MLYLQSKVAGKRANPYDTLMRKKQKPSVHYIKINKEIERFVAYNQLQFL